MTDNQKEEKRIRRRAALIRAVQSLDLENPNADISKKLNYSKGNLSRILNEKAFPSKAFIKMFQESFNIDLNDFESEESQLSLLHEPKSTEYKSDQEINLYDVKVTAGVDSLFNNPESHNIIGTIKIPNMPKVDGAIIATGDSMYPIIKSGDIIIYKIITEIPQSIFFGNTYIVSLDVEGDEMTMVKYVKEGKDLNHVKLVSHNSHHADKEVHIRYINAMALVKASVRFNTLT